MAALIPHPPSRLKHKHLPTHMGTRNRKAYRLGKFLQNVHGLRSSALWRGRPAASRTEALLSALEAVTYTGEGIYYFIDQFIWCALAI